MKTNLKHSHLVGLVQVTVLSLCLVTLANAEWSRVNLSNEELRARGTSTGDGCQWVGTLAVDQTDGQFMLWGTDVGGLFRSTDGGKNWEPSNVGFDSRGSSDATVDPHNPKRIIVVATNTVAHPFNGLYLSTDQAASWKRVYGVQQAGVRDFRTQVVFDPSTYDKEANYTRLVYWATQSEDKPVWGESKLVPGFLKSTDGGETWQRIESATEMAGSFLAVHPTKGYLYAAKPEDGVYLSQDQGKTWRRTMQGDCTGLAVSDSQPDWVYLNLADGVFRSQDSGETWQRLPAADQLLVNEPKKTELRNITVAPSDANRLVMWKRAPDWRWPRYYSHDGGATWQQSVVEKTGPLVPSNTRQGLFAFNPTNPDLILSTGGDYPTRSTDGGKTYKFSGNGVNNILVGGAFQFSVTDPNILCFGSQDYGTLLTKDGGENWQYFEPIAKGWGGFNYGGYSTDGISLVVGEGETWKSPKHRMVSQNGGQTWQKSDQLVKPYASYGDPKNKNTLFAGGYRSTDSGKTWKRMKGADVVYTHDDKTQDLYGLKFRGGPDLVTVVRSSDGGVSWEKVVRLDEKVQDIAVDHERNRLYLPAVWKVFVWEDGQLSEMDTVPKDQEGKRRMLSVAVDPVEPNIVYLAGNRNAFASNASCFRSMDGGKTWQNLNLQEPLDGEKLDGGRESQWVRVHAGTRQPWFATGCYGIWKYSAPPSSEAKMVENVAGQP